MRKIKSLMLVALTLIMGLSMTSCLNSDSTESQYDLAPIVRVYGSLGSYYFVDSAGGIYYPSYASISELEANGFSFSEVNYAFAFLKFIDDETTDSSTDSSTSQKREVDVVGIMSLDGEDVVISQTKEDMDIDAPETAPVVTLDFSSISSYTYSILVSKPILFDLETLIIPSRFNLSNDEDEYKKHKLVLACNMEEVQAGNTNLVFYYRHDKGTDEGKEVVVDGTYCYNIRNAVAEFTAKAGNTPTKIIVKAHEDLYQSGKLPEDYTTYEVEYKDPAQTSQN